MWKKGESGNPKGGKSRRLITTQIERELLTAGADGNATKAREIAMKAVQMAVEGDRWAIQFVTERTEGKPDQTVSLRQHVREISDAELASIASGSGDGITESQDSPPVPAGLH